MTAMEFVTEMDELFWTRARLATFTKWPFTSKDDTCSSERMAAAGFFAVEGEEEEVTAECFICGKQLDGWEASDDPWDEHVKHQADCAYVILNKQKELDWTVKELFNLAKVFYNKGLDRKKDAVVKQMRIEHELRKEKIIKLYVTERKGKKV